MLNYPCTRHNVYNCGDPGCRDQRIFYETMATVDAAAHSWNTLANEVMKAVNLIKLAAGKQAQLADLLLNVHDDGFKGGMVDEEPPF